MDLKDYHTASIKARNPGGKVYGYDYIVNRSKPEEAFIR